MKKVYSFFLVLSVAATALTSCSRSNYSFNNNAPAYLGSEQVHPAAAAPVTAAAEPAATSPAAAELLPTAKLARRAPHASSPVAARTLGKPAATTAASAAPTKVERKAMRSFLKKALLAPHTATADGKSQLVALLLLIFLGGLGIHRFYLGYTGRGILYIALLLTSFLIVPAIALLVLLIIDLIGLITGSLQPKNGQYAKTL